MRRRSASASLTALCAVVVLAACSADESSSVLDPTPSPSRSSSEKPPSPSPTKAVRAETGPPIGAGWGPSRKELARARALVSTMSLSELAGQVIVARYEGTAAPAQMVNDLHLGGVIAFDENIAGTDDVRAANERLQSSAARAGRKWPVFIGVDQEGGIVERVKREATRFPTFMTAGAAAEPRLTTKAAEASGAELTDLGFTVVFAPVADVTSGTDDPTIGSRSAGSRPAHVATQMNAAVDGYLSAGILPVVKHFPGHGSVPADSHVELPVQTKSLTQLMRSDLVPFRSAVTGGVSAVMVAHIDIPAVDPGFPSTLSRKMVTGVLRDKLGFDGIAVTDALNMAGVADRFDSAQSAVRALRAGNDVLLMPPDPRAARDGIVAAVQDRRLARVRLEQAAIRQVAVLLHQRGVRPSVSRKPGTSGEIARRLSSAGVSIVSGPCSGRLVARSVRATGAAEAVARFNAAASRAGLTTGEGSTVALVGYGGAVANADVVVSMDTPYVLGGSGASTAKIALYGDTPSAMRALVDVLLGRASAPGRLPVKVAGVDRTGC